MSGEVSVRVKNALDRLLPGHDVDMVNKLTGTTKMNEWSHNQNRIVKKTVPFLPFRDRIFTLRNSSVKLIKGHEYIFWFMVNQYFPFVNPENNDPRRPNKLQSFKRAIFTRGFFKYKGYKRIRVSEGDRYSSKHKEDRVYIFEDADGKEVRLKPVKSYVTNLTRVLNFRHSWGTHWYFVHDPIHHNATTNLPGRFVTGPVDIMEAPENVLREREKRTYHHGYRNNAARFIQHHFRDMVYNPDRPLGRRRMMEGKARFNAVVRQSA